MINKSYDKLFWSISLLDDIIVLLYFDKKCFLNLAVIYMKIFK